MRPLITRREFLRVSTGAMILAAAPIDQRDRTRDHPFPRRITEQLLQLARRFIAF
ncbi:hypothetical protein HY009_08130 [Candidatus Acetothermia bacterium]|nr:hypothetical protein [Candidatus Acetothermia bacterium]